MSTSKVNASKGRRYTTKEKSEILAFVDKVNAEKGRGGQMAATKKFKLSPLTIASWIRSGITAEGGAPIAASYSAGPIGKKLSDLQSLHGQIVKAEKDLAKMKSQFAALKGNL
ncbi:hypothetical protein [Luteolibacter soli]|uniref:Transposase n=1 Tax=Luteolibacter soli TaxID=3135280 RepID=A0ABU9B5F6_9BACT